ncbi:Dystrophin-like protein [Trichinella pseudospiralis]
MKECAIFSIGWNGRQIVRMKHHFGMCFGTKLRLVANRRQVRYNITGRITKKCRPSGSLISEIGFKTNCSYYGEK